MIDRRPRGRPSLRPRPHSRPHAAAVRLACRRAALRHSPIRRLSSLDVVARARHARRHGERHRRLGRRRDEPAKAAEARPAAVPSFRRRPSGAGTGRRVADRASTADIRPPRCRARRRRRVAVRQRVATASRPRSSPLSLRAARPGASRLTCAGVRVSSAARADAWPAASDRDDAPPAAAARGGRGVLLHVWLCAGTWAGGRRRSTLAACASARGAGQRPGAAAIPVGRREGGTQKGPRRARRSAGARRVPLTFEAAAAAAAAQSGLPSWRVCNQHRWARREGQHDEFRAGGKEGGDGGVAMRPAAQREHGRRVSRGRGDR